MISGLAGRIDQRPTGSARKPQYGIGFNTRRLLEPIGHIPPAEAEARHEAALASEPLAAQDSNLNASEIPGTVQLRAARPPSMQHRLTI